MVQPTAPQLPARVVYGYDAVTDKYVAIKVSSDGEISFSGSGGVSEVDIIKLLGSAIGVGNPLPIRLSNGASYFDLATLATEATLAAFSAKLSNPLPVSLSTLLNPHPVSLSSIPNPSNLDVALSTRLKIADFALTQELGRVGLILTPGGDIIDPRDRNWTMDSSDVVDVSDRANRDLGAVRGNLDVLQQKATSKELKTWSYGREWLLGSSDVPDLLDRAGRLVGIVYGNKGQLQQRTTSLDLLVQLMSGGAEIDPRSIRALVKATDDVYSVLKTDAGVAYDSRLVRALTSVDVVTSQQTTRGSMTVKPEREDLVSLGGVVSPNAAGVQILAPSGQLKPKVYDCEYEVLAAGLHYFYFGTSTAATTRRFLTRQTVGVNSKSFVQPRVGDAADGIYLYSAVSETNMPYDVGYVLEA